jgi:hypothetical protein
MAIDRNIYFGVLLDRDTTNQLAVHVQNYNADNDGPRTSVPELIAACMLIASYLGPQEMHDAVNEMRAQQDDDFQEITDQ